MFCTLKANAGAGEPYASESTSPPFVKRRAGKLDKVACTNCRISKLRCSGGPGCCRRCCGKRLLCKYPSPPEGSRAGHHRSKGSATTMAAARTLTPPATGRTPTPPATGMDEMMFSADDSIHDFGTLCLPSPAPGESEAPVDDGINGHFEHELKSLRRDQQQQHQQHHHQYISVEATQDTYAFHPELTADIGDLVFDSPLTFVSPKTPANTSSSSASTSAGTNASIRWPCSCMQQAISVNESIEIISWSQRDSSSDVYDVLQQQKASLLKCEDFLGCPDCISQPAYMMMLLSMYRKLLETLEMVTVRHRPGENQDADNTVDQRKRKKEAGYDMRGIMTGVNGGSNSATGSISSTASQRDGGYTIGQRERGLDDDDESLVLMTLVKVRVKMLRRIVGTVDDLLSQQNWPVHRGMCRELRHRLDSGFII